MTTKDFKKKLKKLKQANDIYFARHDSIINLKTNIMTKQELSKYAGKKTFGKNNEMLTNGIVVGYYPNDDEECLIARFENGGVSGAGWKKTDYKIKFFTKEEEEIYNSGKGCYLFAKIDNVIMEEELDLTKILEGCEGVELWSDICGKCSVESVCKSFYPVSVKTDTGNKIYFMADGRFDQYPNGKCLLWPSETCRDWSQFKKPIKIKEGDWVVCGWSVRDVAIRRYFKDDKCFNEDSSLTLSWTFIAPFEKYDPNLSDEELKKLSIV